ncbi:unnamed protein product [Nippostrongylus brasiliensis]|uniref:Bestrophin homolog n=1 Tax=Nippostrongylus brasiliensis TaxID=27835 RepID=A0A0N4YLU4_NIPBR|nr:unnamed protein product [Nippostrongylus brasiliensis]
MTISYNIDVSSGSSFTFLKLLLRWRGSIWKSLKTEFAVWIVSYYIVFCIYRYALTPTQQSAALSLAALLRNGSDEKEARLMRRSIIRYMVLTQILVYRDISMRVHRRFPSMQSIVDEGFMMEHELQIFENVEVSQFKKYWVPVNWASTILARARREEYIASDPCYIVILKELLTFRTNMAWLSNYDWVPIPLAYPQVVFLAVRSYFLICLVSRQFLLRNESSAPNTVAEALLNPLGEDDDDFECNYLIDRNITCGMAIVDQTEGACPQMTMDILSSPEKMQLNRFPTTPRADEDHVSAV